ncbi:hypothetical protein BJF78_28070 [Pseudonocardia sp. CNS-139]|nr:hypothetical protein BJF78_28070 [Pseudonocardia sp. CNS-139]
MVVPHQESDRLRTLTPYGSPMLATYGQRVAGFLIDIGIPAAVLAAVMIAALMTRDWSVVLVVHGVALAVGLVFVVWNSCWCQGRKGQSIGKWVLGTRLVAAATGEPVGFRNAAGRQVAHLLDGLPLWLGYLWPLWDEQHQTFADKVCSTLVVQADV